MLSSENTLDYEIYTGRWCQSENEFFVNHGVEEGGGGDPRTEKSTVFVVVVVFVWFLFFSFFASP